MVMLNRAESSGDYRYGFNDMEMDDEIKGIGNSYDFGARMYDSRVGRFFSVDPLTSDFAHESPYAAFANNPIVFNDPTGESPNPAQIKRRQSRLKQRLQRKYGKTSYSMNAVFLNKIQRKYFGGSGGSDDKESSNTLKAPTTDGKKGNSGTTGWDFEGDMTAGTDSGPFVSIKVDQQFDKGDPTGLISEDWETSQTLNLDVDKNGGAIFVRSEIMGGFKAELRITYKDGSVVTSSVGNAPQKQLPEPGEDAKDMKHPKLSSGLYIRYDNSEDNPIVKMEVVTKANENGRKVHLDAYPGGKKGRTTSKFWISVKKK